MELHEITQRVSQIPHWRHRIELPGGIWTPGSQNTADMLAHLGLPASLDGRTVLDVGCSDGFFSFECERRGARRVVAADNFSSVYVSSAAGFLTARELIGSRVEFLDVDLFDLSPDRHGTFDVVLFLGVLYHLRHPLLALDTLAAICTEQLIVETVVTPTPQSVRARLSRALAQDQYESAPSMAFFESDEINHDPTTWWAPTVPCLTAMLRSCGFENVETVWAEGDRAIVRGYHPRLTGAGEALVAKYGAARVADAYAHVTATPAPAQLAQALGALTIREYGRVKQHAIEATARQWHQHTRWTSQ